jgi:hypothetical protein
LTIDFCTVELYLTITSGLVLLHPHRGDSTLAVTVLVASALSVVVTVVTAPTVVSARTVAFVHPAAVAPPLVGTAPLLLARTTVVSAITTAVIATGLGALTAIAR